MQDAAWATLVCLVRVGTSAAVRLKSPAFRSLTSLMQLLNLSTDTFAAQLILMGSSGSQMRDCTSWVGFWTT